MRKAPPVGPGTDRTGGKDRIFLCIPAEDDLGIPLKGVPICIRQRCSRCSLILSLQSNAVLALPRKAATTRGERILALTMPSKALSLIFSSAAL